MSATLATLSATWPLPQAADLAGQYAQSYRQAFPGCNPLQPNSFMSVTCRVHGMVGFNLYLYQRSLADELMADTARVWLPRHADQWGVPRLAPSFAVGNVIFTGPAGLALPDEIELVAQDGSGTQWITRQGGQIGPTGVLSLAVQCEVAGSVGNASANTVLTIISPIVGLQNQSVIVDGNGLAGGSDVEPIEAWRARIELRIRKRGRAGNRDDYIDWAEAAGAAPTPNIIPGWAGPATIGVVVAMPNPAAIDRLVPTPAQLAAIMASIGAVRPVTDQPVGIPAVQLAQPLTMALNPDTVTGRLRAQAAASAFLANLAIGALLERSLLENAIVQASGAAVQLNVPAADVQAAPTHMFTTGGAPPTFVAYVVPAAAT